MALERVSMLEDQLAASSQEVKDNTNDLLSLKDACCEDRNIHLYRLFAHFVSPFPGNLFKRPN